MEDAHDHSRNLGFVCHAITGNRAFDGSGRVGDDGNGMLGACKEHHAPSLAYRNHRFCVGRKEQIFKRDALRFMKGEKASQFVVEGLEAHFYRSIRGRGDAPIGARDHAATVRFYDCPAYACSPRIDTHDYHVKLLYHTSMQLVIKYALAGVVGAAIVALTSLLWPKITTEPEPAPLEQVRDTVLGTEVGQTAANLLGVADKNVQPVNMTDTISSVAGVVTSSVEQKVQQIVSDQVATQVIKQYQQLPATQQDRVEEMICKPKE